MAPTYLELARTEVNTEEEEVAALIVSMVDDRRPFRPWTFARTGGGGEG